MYMFVQDPHQLLTIMGGSFLVFWFFHVGVSALHTYLISRSTRLASLHRSCPQSDRRPLNH